VVSVAAVDLATGRRFERHADAIMPAASTIKVLVSAALWTAVERGGIDADGASPSPRRRPRAAARGDDNTTCAADMVALLCALARADDIPVRACWRVLASLAQTQHTDVIPRHLPPSDRVICCKQGELETVRHDVGLIDEGDRRVALAVLSAPPADAAGLARVAALAYDQVAPN
jgi:beta-lactamase class A